MAESERTKALGAFATQTDRTAMPSTPFVGDIQFDSVVLGVQI